MRIGIDIGGTKCAVVLGDREAIRKKRRFETTDCAATLERIMAAVAEMGEAEAIGISCGGPLDSREGLILSPPNLKGWDAVPITRMLTERFGIPARLCNDANACALAEWQFGAGRGTRSMVFLTFGTGLGAGLILNGQLFEGATGMAGEIGHMRLSAHGPVGYAKAGSFEGFCSGGGIAQLGRTLALERLQAGRPAAFCPDASALDRINAAMLADYARRGDETAAAVYRLSGEMLGRGLAVLADVLDPEVIVIGSIFARAEELLRAPMEEVLAREALRPCRVVPAALGEAIGDYAALAVAYGMETEGA